MLLCFSHGADFVISERWRGNGNLVRGLADDEAACLDLEDAWDWGVHPSVMEQLSDGSVLVIAGQAEAVRTETGLGGRLTAPSRSTAIPR